MSRIGKNPVALPAGVTATVDGQTVKVKGPKGELKVVLVTIHMALRQAIEKISVSAPGTVNDGPTR